MLSPYFVSLFVFISFIHFVFPCVKSFSLTCVFLLYFSFISFRIRLTSICFLSHFVHSIFLFLFFSFIEFLFAKMRFFIVGGTQCTSVQKFNLFEYLVYFNMKRRQTALYRHVSLLDFISTTTTCSIFLHSILHAVQSAFYLRIIHKRMDNEGQQNSFKE